MFSGRMISGRPTINALFDKVLVLNLDRRPDRLARVAAQARRHGIAFEPFPAVDGRAEAVHTAWRAYAAGELARPPTSGRPVQSYRQFYLDYDSHEARVAFMEQMLQCKAIVSSGAWGLMESKIAILRRALAEGWQSLLVFEDDVLLHRDTPELFARIVAQAPADWKIIQLGALQMHWEEHWISWHSENLYRCNGSSIGAHAVGMRREVFEPLLREAERRDLPYDIGPLSAIKRRFAPQCLTMWPNLAIQDANDSEIGSSTIFFREARKENNLYRWHLPDYGSTQAIPMPRPAVKPADGPTKQAHEPGKGSASAVALEVRKQGLMNGWSWKADNLRRLLGYARTIGRRPQPAGFTDAPDPVRAGDGTAPGLRSAAAPASPPLTARPGEAPLVPFANERPEAKVVLVAVFGLGSDELGRVIELVEGQCAAAGAVPIFLTDSDDFQPFRSRRLLFEYLAPPSDGARVTPGLDWDLYRQRRLALLRRKWQPGRIIAFGPTASEIVAAWRESPFENNTISDVIISGNRRASGLR